MTEIHNANENLDQEMSDIEQLHLSAAIIYLAADELASFHVWLYQHVEKTLVELDKVAFNPQLEEDFPGYVSSIRDQITEHFLCHMAVLADEVGKSILAYSIDTYPHEVDKNDADTATSAPVTL